MHPNALLELATDLLHQVLRFDAPADGIVTHTRGESQLLA